MPAEIRVYREGYDTIFPADAPEPDSSLRGLIRNYVELYVETGRPEVVAYIPSQTTVLDLRRENLFYHYRPADPAALATEFRDLLEVLHEPDISDGGEDHTAQARDRGLPDSLVESGVFREGWSLDRSESSAQLAMEFADAEPAFPGLSRLQRQVVLDLLGEQRLVLGIEEFSAGLQAIQYLLTTDEDVRVAIATREDATTLSTVDIVLVPGADRNFEPFDSESASALNDKTGEKIENWTTELKSDATEAIDQLVSGSDRSIYATYRDLGRIERHLRDDKSVGVDSESASEIIAINEEVETSEHLNAADRSEVTETILDSVERAQETVADQIRAAVVPPMTEAILSLGERGDDPFTRYENLETASETVAAEDSLEIPPEEGFPRELETVRGRWRELLEKTERGDAVREEIRAEVQREIDSTRDEIEETLATEAIERLEKALDDLEAGNRGNTRQYITEVRAIGWTINREKDAENLPRQTRQKLDPVIDFLTSDEHDEVLRENLRSHLETKLSEALLDVYERTVKTHVTEYCDRSSNPWRGLAAIREAIKTGNAGDHSRDSNIRDAITLIQDALDENFLRDREITAFRDAIESLVDERSEERKENYKEKFRTLIGTVDADPAAPQREVNIYDQFLAVIDGNGRPDDYPADVKNFRSRWSEMLQDDALSSDQKREIITETGDLIREQRQTAKRRVTAATEKKNRSSSVWSITVGSVEIPTVGIVVVLVAILVLVAVFFQPSIPFLTAGGPPELVLESPEQGQQIEGTAVQVSGTTTADSVKLEFTPLTDDRDPPERAVPASNGSFEDGANLSVGSYLLTVSAGGNTTDPRVFTYLGGPDTTVSITGIETGLQAPDGTTQSDGGPDSETPTPTESTERYDVGIELEVTGSLDRVAITLYDSDGERVDRTVESNQTGSPAVTLTTPKSGVHIVEASAPNVTVDRLEDRRAVDVG